MSLKTFQMILQFVLLGLFQLACAQTTSYIGDGFCDDENEACVAYSFLFWEYSQDVVCCTEDEFCDSNYGCEELPLEMRYRESDQGWNFIGCCELIVTTTPEPTTTTSFISYYEGDGNCTEELEACEEKRNWRGKVIKEADVACCSLDWLCSEQGYIGDFSITCNDLPFDMADMLLENITVYDECCNKPLPTDPATTTTTISVESTTTEIVTTISITTTREPENNEIVYVGDGFCDDLYEACQEERNFWGSITLEQDLACCDEDEVCGIDGLISQNLISCGDLPLDFRYEAINSDRKSVV